MILDHHNLRWISHHDSSKKLIIEALGIYSYEFVSYAVNSSSRSSENSQTIILNLFPNLTTFIEDKEDIIDNLLNDDPIPEYERLTFDMEPDVPVINNVDELNKDECFDPRGVEINVEVDDSFTFVTRNLSSRWRCSGAWDGDGGSGVIMVVVLWWAAVGRQPKERAARGSE
ncbi:hypothetical protein Tco_0404724 [Tanacetum coccineum]